MPFIFAIFLPHVSALEDTVGLFRECHITVDIYHISTLEFKTQMGWK